MSRNKRHHKPRTLWKWEILALLGSVVSLIGMITVLAVYDNKEIFSWNGITLNAVISVLSTTCKALLLFALGGAIGQWKWTAFAKAPRPLIDLERVDAVSRGPLGSLKWLWISNWKQISLLHVGAAIPLLVLALDPFAQQLVQYKQRLKSSPDVSTTIARAQRFSKGTAQVPSTVPRIMTAIADFTVQAGVFNALVQPYVGLVQQTSFTCPTGNCTWDPFQSLAICSTCNDLTSQIYRYSEPSYLYNNLQAANHYSKLQKRIAVASLTKNATSFEVPNGLYLNNVNGAPYHNSEVLTVHHSDNVTQTIFMTSFGTGNTSRTNEFRERNDLLWAMSFLKLHTPSNGSVDFNEWPNIAVEALECGLFYCVNEYVSTVQSGTLQETETWLQNATRQPDSWKLNGHYGYPNLDGIYIDEQRMTSLEFNTSSSGWSRTDLTLGDGFNVSWEAVNSLSSQFQSQFTSQDVINITEHANYSALLGYTPVNGFYKNQVNSMNPKAVDYSPTVMQILYSSPDLNDTFRRLARGLSNAIRAGADDSTVHTGASGVMTTHYRIQWPWIVLHIIMLTGVAWFLSVTIYDAGKAGVPVWKSSALAFLSLTHEIGDVLVELKTVAEMEAKATKLFVQLFEHGSEHVSD